MEQLPAQFVEGLASRVQVWPSDLWRYQWFTDYPRGELGGSELLSLTHPEVIRSAHQEIVDAGADALVTNTYGANGVVMEQYDAASKVTAANRECARLALNVANQSNRMRFVVGSLGPTVKLVTLKHIEFEGMVAVYQEQVEALAEAGVEIFHIEGCQDVQNAKAALTAIATVEAVSSKLFFKVVTGRAEQEGMLFGNSFCEFYEIVKPFGVSAFGAVGHYELVEQAIRSLHDVDVPLIAMLDLCTLPVPVWIETPESFSARLSAIVRENPRVRIVGTGTLAEPEFIRALSESLNV